MNIHRFNWGIDFIILNNLWRKYQNHTMINKRRYIDNLALARFYVKKHKLHDYSIIECGTWRGGVSFGLVDACPKVSEFHFFDSYEGLPDAGEFDGDKAINEQNSDELWHNNNSADYDSFMSDIKKFQLSNRNITVHKGWFDDTLPKFTSDRDIGILRLDGDWYDSTMSILNNLFDRVVPGGLILIDDYYDWEGCSKAIHDFLSARKLSENIRQSHPGGVAYIIKN